MKRQQTKTGALPHSAGFPGTNKVKPKMRVFKFHSGEYFYAVSAATELEAKKELFWIAGEMPIDNVKDIPETEWDKRTIEMYEDNDRSRKQFFVSIRDLMYEHDPVLLFTNDTSIID